MLTVFWELDIYYMNLYFKGCAVALMASHWSLACPGEIFNGESDTGTGFFFTSTSICPCRYHSTSLCTGLFIHFYQKCKQARLENLEGYVFSMDRRVYVHIFLCFNRTDC